MMTEDDILCIDSRAESYNGNKSCLIVGAGAIGKSVAGYVFRQLGYRLTFIDVQEEIIADLNRRNSYIIHCAQTGKPIEKIRVRDVVACHVNSQLARELAVEADIICTAVGPTGMKGFLPILASWMLNRHGVYQKKLYVMLFENDAECKNTVTTFIDEVFGFHPDWLTVVDTSIERMAMTMGDAASGFDVISEQYIPIIAPNDLLTEIYLGDKYEYFMLVERVIPYYYRKLYTNNLGHAVLGYVGMRYGHTDAVSAMGDPRVFRLLSMVLDESGRMLVNQFGFTIDQMEEHNAALLQRYRNNVMNDHLQRLVRDPVRKLGRTERITGALERCLKSGIHPDGIIKVLFYALMHDDPSDPSACEITDIVKNHGIGEAISRICGISKNEFLHNELCSRYKLFINEMR